MIQFLLILASTSFAASDSDFARVKKITDPCRPNCDPTLISITGEEIAKVWQKEIDNAPKRSFATPTVSPTATPDLRIRYNRLSKQIEEKRQEWLKCKDGCSTRFIDSIGQLWMDLWEEGKNPEPVKPAVKKP